MILVENIQEELKHSMEWMKIFKNLLMIQEDQTKIVKATCPRQNKNKTKKIQKVMKKKQEQTQEKEK